MVCKECNEIFESEDKNRKFCSRSHAATYNNRLSPKRRPQGKCAGCGTEISTSRRYCSKECYPQRVKRTMCKDCPSTDLVDKQRCRLHYNEYMREYVKARYHRLRNEWLEKLGSKCKICGSRDGLEFDHVDESIKEFDIAKILSSHNKEKVAAEMAKCQLLCEEHHAAKTAKFNSVGHGEGKTGKKNCRCSLCGPLKNAYARRYKKVKAI